MKQETKTRVLFFAFGDSIHARRRIGVFTADASFEVGVVSTFQYDFENAQNYYLSNVNKDEAPNYRRAPSLVRRMVKAVLAFPLYVLLRLSGTGVGLIESWNLIADALLVRRYVRGFKPEVLFLQTLMYPSYMAYFLPCKIPIVVTFWNGDVTWWAKWNGIERAFKKRIVLHGVRRAKAITVNSSAALEACLGYGAKNDKVKLIRYPGVDLDLFKRAPFDPDKKERVVLCPRGLSAYLNNDVIIEAAAGVVKRFPDTVFTFLAGPGLDDVWNEHMRRAAELHIASNIRRESNVQWEAMPRYYNAADVMVSMSSNDSLPNCMLEAMACGVPVVMGDIPQIREWVRDGENGFLVPIDSPEILADRIIKILSDSEGIVSGFVNKSMELIQREVDSRKVANRIKDLVRAVAKGSKVGTEKSSELADV